MDLFNQPEMPVHKYETGAESQRILETNRKRLSRNCSVLYEALMRGEVLNSVNVVKNYGIIDFRARCGDLYRVNGIHIHNKPSSLGGGIKDWYMDNEDIEYNKKIFPIK